MRELEIDILRYFSMRFSNYLLGDARNNISFSK